MATKKFKSDVQLQALVKLPNKTASRALILDGSKNLENSAVTSTELGNLSGSTENVQTALDAKIPSSEKGANNGVATLDAGGKIPSAQLPNSVMEFQGNHDVATNSPTLIDGTGNTGDVYRISVAGTRDYGSGSQTFVVGDWITYNGTIWEKSPGSDAVLNVNSQTGAVTLDADDIDDAATTNKFVTAADVTKLGHISVTQAVDLDTMESDIATNNAKVSADGSVTSHNDVTDAGSGAIITSAERTKIGHITVTQAVDLDTIESDLAGHLDGGANKHDASEIDYERLDGSKKNIDAASDDVETALTDLDDAIGALAASPSNYSPTDASIVADHLAGIDSALASIGSAGDIAETSFSAANNVTVAANVTGLAFANGTVRSFDAQVSVVIAATADLYEVFRLQGIQKGASWDMSVESTGDDSGIVFTITSAGQVQYTSGNEDGFVSSTMKFRAATTSV